MATFIYFVLDGTLMGMWLVQIPAVEQRVGISNATLGSLLVVLGLAAFIGMVEAEDETTAVKAAVKQYRNGPKISAG